MYTLTHKWSDIDVIYKFPNSKTTLCFGAGSYSSNLKIYDYAPSLPDGSESGAISIGRYTSIADQVSIHLFGAHDIYKVTTSPLMPIIENYQIIGEPEKAENVYIGNDVWIGNGALILSDVVIGDGAVIGANCVVSKNVPPYAVAVGNPMRIIKYRFDDKVIERLLITKWWEWSHEKIKLNSKLLMSRDIIEFINNNP